jgi:DNA-binding response OmpR family regulator
MAGVLIVEADEQCRRERGDQLLMDGYEVGMALTAQEARVKLAAGPDAVVLCDAGSPPVTIGLLRDLRGGEIPRADAQLPVLVVGADTDSDAVRYYSAGADIALPSSSSPLLIAAGLRALDQRTGVERRRRRILRVGSLTVDCDARVAQVDGTPVRLTRLEFDLLQTLAGQPHRAFTRTELTREVWGYDPAPAGPSRTIDSHSSRLRQKLEQAGAEPLVQNVRGVGWRLTR